MNDSQVVLVGNVVRDLELKYTPSGRPTASFSLAVSRSWKDSDGTRQERTSYFDVVAWSTLAENVAASVNKGTRVIVTGRLEQRTWETKEGEKRSVVEIVADEVGPSLRWARAEVERIERDKPVARPNRAPDPVYGDELDAF